MEYGLFFRFDVSCTDHDRVTTEFYYSDGKTVCAANVVIDIDSVRFLFHSYGQTPSTKHFIIHLENGKKSKYTYTYAFKLLYRCIQIHTYTHIHTNDIVCVSKRITTNADDLLKIQKATFVYAST